MGSYFVKWRMRLSPTHPYHLPCRKGERKTRMQSKASPFQSGLGFSSRSEDFRKLIMGIGKIVSRSSKAKAEDQCWGRRRKKREKLKNRVFL